MTFGYPLNYSFGDSAEKLIFEFGGFAYGRHERSKLVRIARKLSEVEPQVQKRNFPSVEQIQEKSRRPLIIKRMTFGYPLNYSFSDNYYFDYFLHLSQLHFSTCFLAESQVGHVQSFVVVHLSHLHASICFLAFSHFEHLHPFSEH